MSDISPPPPTIKKRAQVKNACVNCQRACKKCDSGRPCQRCVKYSLQETCIDSKRKPRAKGIKRGPYKKRKRPDITLTTPPLKTRTSANVTHSPRYPIDDDDSSDAYSEQRTNISDNGLITPRSSTRRTTTTTTTTTTKTKTKGLSPDIRESPTTSIESNNDIDGGLDLRLPPIGTFDPPHMFKRLPTPQVSPLSLLSNVAVLQTTSNPSSPLLLPSVRKHIPPLSASRFDCSYRIPPRMPTTITTKQEDKSTNSPEDTCGMTEYMEMESSFTPEEGKSVRRLSQLLGRTRIDQVDKELNGHWCLANDNAGSSSTISTPGGASPGC